MNFETLFELDQQQAKIDDYVANLKKNPIMKERGKTLAEWYPLPQKIIDAHGKAIEEANAPKYGSSPLKKRTSYGWKL